MSVFERPVVNSRDLLRDLADAEQAWMREISAMRGNNAVASLYRPAHAALYPPVVVTPMPRAQDVSEEGTP